MQHDDNAVPNEDQPNEDQPNEDQPIQIGGVILQHDDNAVPNEDQQTITDASDGKGNPGAVYHMIGIITIIFGIIVGILLVSLFFDQQQTLFFSSKSELTFGAVVTALGVSLNFIVPGVICIGVGKVIDLLDK